MAPLHVDAVALHAASGQHPISPTQAGEAVH